jgi:hypothetical protein
MQNTQIISMIFLLVVVVIVTISHLFTLASSTVLAEDDLFLRSALESVHDGITPFYIKFISSVNSQESWTVPYDFLR